MPTLTEPKTDTPEVIESDTLEPPGPDRPAGDPDVDQVDQASTFRRRTPSGRLAA
ncbi:hypothetical protein [Streptomyces sp. NPDC020141]|uniref:hypothetical protein n=1 Tax=Streptomyces sp. NPDC020141 TaxID=3365065 RepID=UPI003799F7B8